MTEPDCKRDCMELYNMQKTGEHPQDNNSINIAIFIVKTRLMESVTGMLELGINSKLMTPGRLKCEGDITYKSYI